MIYQYLTSKGKIGLMAYLTTFELAKLLAVRAAQIASNGISDE
jgi:hypothetical protein